MKRLLQDASDVLNKILRGLDHTPIKLYRPANVATILAADPMKHLPPFQKTRTPLRVLYRMYQFLVLGHPYDIREEADYFFKCGDSSWAIALIPDPHDPDPERYAILAVLAQCMVESFNRAIEQGRVRGGIFEPDEENILALRRTAPERFETMPPWAAKVPKLAEELDIPYGLEPHRHSADDESKSERFWAMNIRVKEFDMEIPLHAELPRVLERAKMKVETQRSRSQPQ